MSRHSHFEPGEPGRTDQSPPLGAIELTSFDTPAANDNAAHRGRTQPKPPAGFGLPAVAFASGVTAALIVAGLGHLLGITV